MPRRLLALLLLAWAPSAWAAVPLLKLAQVDASRCAEDGILRVFLSEVERTGELAPSPATSYRLVLDGTLQAGAPVRAEALEKSEVPLRVGLVVQASTAFEGATEPLGRAGERLVSGLPARARLDLTTYASELQTLATRAPPSDALAAWATFAPMKRETTRFLDAISSALSTLAEPPGARRRALVVISSGRDEQLSRERVKALAAQAVRAGVSIMPIAFSPTQAREAEDREPFLALGELARQTGGTFRWAETAEGLVPAAERVAEELRVQWVLEFAVEDACAAGHRAQVGREQLRSNALPVPVMAGSRGGLGWVLGGLGVVVMLGVGAWWVKRRR